MINKIKSIFSKGRKYYRKYGFAVVDATRMIDPYKILTGRYSKIDVSALRS